MIRTGEEYRESLRDGREVWMSGERVHDVTTHPQFRPIVDARARIYDMAHEDATRDVMSYVGRRRRAQCDLDAAPPHARALGRQAAHGRRRVRRARRRGHARGRRDGRRDVVAVRRQGGAGRGRPAVVGQHRAAHPARTARGSVPRLRQHRSEGRSLQAAAGSGPRHAAARRARDRQRHRRARRQVRDRGCLLQPGLREAHDCQLGRLRAVGVRGRLHRRDGVEGAEAHLPRGLRGPGAGGRLPDREPLRRDRHAARVRRRRDPVGERPLLPPHPRGELHPRHAAPLQRVRLRAAQRAAWPT